MNDKTPLATPPRAAEAEKTLSRRKLFRAAVATAPVVLTLPSGAALARSSNLIGETTPGGALDGLSRTLCLDRRSGAADMGTKIDLGTPASGYGVQIVDRDYHTSANAGSPQVSEGQMCANGGTYYYKPSSGPWVPVSVNGTVGGTNNPGMLVSATALSSFAGSIYMTEI